MAGQGTARRLVAAVALALVAVLAGGGTAGAAVDPPCTAWSTRTVASNLGVLENLEPDGRGGMLLSMNDANAIRRLAPDGSVTTVIPDVPSPGGQRIHGGYLYFNTGDSAQAGVLQTTDGTVQRYDPSTGARTTWTSGLSMPNGLLFLPNGDAVVSRDSPGWGITRIPSSDPAHFQRNWVTTNDSNGMAVDPTKTWLYFDQTFQPGNPVMRARLDDPSDVEQVAALGAGLTLDDLTIDRDGILYIASNRPPPLGGLIRFDPYTKQQCTVATGLSFPSAVKFGCGPGWPSNRMYVTGFGGDVYEVSAPKGVKAPSGACDR